MTGIIITGHGKISSGIYESLRMIYGINDNIKYLDFLEDNTYDNLKNQIKVEIDNLLKTCEGVICLTDIKGGTPFKICSELSISNDKISVISGLNLPMLISVASEMEFNNLQDSVLTALDSGKSEIEQFKLVIKEEKVDFEDGI